MHNIAIIVIRQCGLVKSMAVSMFSSIRQATHKVLMGFGLSNKEYGGSLRVNNNLLPIMGVGQGNGAGLAIWAIVSSVLFMIM